MDAPSPLSAPFPRASHSICSGIDVSFEFFPPQTEEMEALLWTSIERLGPLVPELRVRHLRRRRQDARAHPCDRRADLEGDADQAGRASDLRRRQPRRGRCGRPRYWDIGVRHIVALRGDPQNGPGTAFEPHPDGYANLDRRSSRA